MRAPRIRSVSTGRCPTPSRRQPIFARNVVATSQPLATQAGIAMLQRGGNAVDAALATAITLTVVEPCSNGIGSDLFAIVWDGQRARRPERVGTRARGGDGRALRGRERRYRSAAGRRSRFPARSPAGSSLSQRFGALPFADLFEPAIRYARDGYAVSPVVAEKWALATTVLPHDLGFAEHFMPHGRAPLPGEVFASPAMARTLEKIAATHGNAFYRGELAEAMVADAKRHGAAHTLADFARS